MYFPRIEIKILCRSCNVFYSFPSVYTQILKIDYILLKGISEISYKLKIFIAYG